MNPTSNHPRRAYWLKTLHQWHWVSSALCLLGMLLFGVTGITLNHAGQIEARPEVVMRTGRLPAALASQLAAGGEAGRAAPLPPALTAWIQQTWSVEAGEASADWSPEEVYVTLGRPGGDAWIRIDRASGEAEYEVTDRGWVSYLNDLHKGRHAGTAWRWFIDIFAAATLVFSITGLFILKMHASSRPVTWPIVGLGVLIPLLLALLFIH